MLQAVDQIPPSLTPRLKRHVVPRLPPELWCTISAHVLGDFLLDVVTRPCAESEPFECWDAIAVLSRTCRVLRACTLAHLRLLCETTHFAQACAIPGSPPDAAPHPRSLRSLLRKLTDTECFVLEEWDYAPGSRFFDPPRLPAALSDACGPLPPLAVFARLYNTLAASRKFVQAGFTWFPFDAPEVFGLEAARLLVETCAAVPAYVRAPLIGGLAHAIAGAQLERIHCEVDKATVCAPPPGSKRDFVYQGPTAGTPLAKTPWDDLLATVTSIFTTELNYRLIDEC
ncbi:hypothetical protein BC834DRAFT_845371 [Gloeopeniophorella convolvens]|nr:hypothetical protein BC834DRAFT_845371 [Gloeopeniophorella convolvens]